MAATPSSPDQSKKPSSRPDFPKMEEDMAADWDKKNIFERSIEERPENKTFVFYDGPPFATGVPHYGHLLQSVVKDAIPRYKTMQGYRVPRRWGWDCHGLPVENLIEKELKLTSKRDIEAYGVEGFTNACRLSVFTYVKEWNKYITRLGRWVDMEHAYQTMSPEYIESVWWVFSELVKKGFVYKDRRVSLYCTRCATPLSHFEISMGNSYVEHEDPAITIKFKEKGKENAYFLAWTTTPWTLPANVALAVHPEIVYVTVRIAESGEELTFAESRMSDILSQFYPLEDPHHSAKAEHRPFEIVARRRGSELEGIAYEPLYTFLPAEGGHHIVTAEYVSEEDGTGIVHTAPAFGEEDMQTAKAHELPVVETLDTEGRFISEITPWSGLLYRDANEPIMEDLEKRGLLYRRKTIHHSVPVCWRCSTLLIYRAQPAWFVNVTKLKPKLLETAKRINWHPAHFKDGRFGKGLEQAPDWNISRTRYWGAPLPVWECDVCPERVVVGSIAELKKRATPESFPAELDLHRPAIDHVTLTCACGGPMHRVPDVFDCWFESGSMPYAAEHYPFENEKELKTHFPADFIGEAQDQTRGWFYVLHVLATALTGKPAFRDVIVTGLIMAEDGKKMSKSLKNYPDPWEVLTTYGADALRLYLLSSPVLEADQLSFSTRELEDMQRKVLALLWNVATFYKTYAGNDAVELAKPRSAHILDRWLFARLHTLIGEVTEAYDGYDLIRTVRPLRGFIDDLSTWWLRRSRGRMRDGDPDDRMDALKTLREVILDLTALMAPAAPFLADHVYLELGGTKASVHLERWPKADTRLIDDGLLSDMALIRASATAGLEQRATAKMPIRQALASATVFLKDEKNVTRLSEKSDLLMLLKDELNVEDIHVVHDASEESIRVELDTELTPALREKGMARELVRHIMALRKKAGLMPADRIRVAVATTDKELQAVVERLSDQIAGGVKAETVSTEKKLPDDMESAELELDAGTLTVGIERV